MFVLFNINTAVQCLFILLHGELTNVKKTFDFDVEMNMNTE